MAETSRDFDTCGFIHKNGWRCGGMRKNHSDNYKEHEFTEVTTNPTPTQQETLELCPFCGTKPEMGITGDAALSAMWQALIRETCINPASAKTVVFLGEEKFRQALAPFVKSPTPAESWIDKLAGTFDDSPVYAEVIANEKRARQWMEEGRCVSCGALPSDAPAESTRVEGERPITFDWIRWETQAIKFCDAECYAAAPEPTPTEWDILALLQDRNRRNAATSDSARRAAEATNEIVRYVGEDLSLLLASRINVQKVAAIIAKHSAATPTDNHAERGEEESGYPSFRDGEMPLG